MLGQIRAKLAQMKTDFTVARNSFRAAAATRALSAGLAGGYIDAPFDEEGVAELLVAGADPNAASGPDGFTLLQRAVRRKSRKLVALLLKRGEDPNARGDRYDPPLLLAVRLDESEIVKALLAAGADQNARDGTGRTALHLAMKNRCGLSILSTASIVKALLDAGADPNARDLRGDAPLHVAAGLIFYSDLDEDLSLEIVQILLAAGADPKARNDAGKLPEDLADEPVKGALEFHRKAAEAAAEAAEILDCLPPATARPRSLAL